MGTFKTIEQVRRWHEKTLADWPQLIGAHEREAQAHDAIAFLLNGPSEPSMDEDMRERIAHELNLREAQERY